MPDENKTPPVNEKKAQPAKPITIASLFSPRKVDESKLKLLANESEGVCRVYCVVSGVSSSFRSSAHPEMVQKLKATTEETSEWMRQERKAAAKDKRPSKV